MCEEQLIVEETKFQEDLLDLNNLISFSNSLKQTLTMFQNQDVRGHFTTKAVNKVFKLVEDKYHPVPEHRKEKEVNLFELIKSHKVSVDGGTHAKFHHLLHKYKEDKKRIELIEDLYLGHIKHQSK